MTQANSLEKQTGKTLPVAVHEVDLRALDLCRVRIKRFIPSRSTLARLLLRDAMLRLLQGRVSLQQISDLDDIGRIQDALK